MKIDERKPSNWPEELIEQVQTQLDELTAAGGDDTSASEAELRRIEESIQGWRLSLANPKLSQPVRESLEKDWEQAEDRRAEIEAWLEENRARRTCHERLVRHDDVMTRLERLDLILAQADPTRGNLELSLHIDKILCRSDGSVQVRMCKLGLAPEAVDALSLPTVVPGDDTIGTKQSRARRRGKLRVIDNDSIDLDAQAAFIAETERFSGLADEWFWIDEFQQPDKKSNTKCDDAQVFRRRQESHLSYSALAKEFDVTSPTIGNAIRRYLAAHPGERDEVRVPRGGNRKPTIDVTAFGEEARQLWAAGTSKEALAEKYSVSSPTIVKAIQWAYAERGETMPTEAELRLARVIEARRRFDANEPWREIAAVMNLSERTVTQYVAESLAAEGRTLPDRRRTAAAS